MADTYSKGKRSEIMRSICGKETQPEMQIRKFLFANGFRFRKNVRELPGKPDIVLPKHETVILVHGCFWHGHNCKAGKLPETRRDFWDEKISKTVQRDLRDSNKLRSLGWRVIVIWQCEFNTGLKRGTRLNLLIDEIQMANKLKAL